MISLGFHTVFDKISQSWVSLTFPPLLSHLARLQINEKIEIIVQGTPICYLGLPVVKILTHLHSLKIIHIYTFIHIYGTGLQIYEESLLIKIWEGGKESLFKPVLLRYHLYTIKFTCLKYTIQLFLEHLELYHRHQNPVLENFHYSRKKYNACLQLIPNPIPAPAQGKH